MRTYRPRPTELRHCVHCHAPFESNHKRRIYCGNSCSTLAYYARRAATLAGTSPALGTPLSPVAGPSAPLASPPPAVTLAANVQNTLVLAGSTLLADAVKHVVGQLFAPAPRQGPSTWLPQELLQLRPALVLLHHADWEEPLFFRPLPYEGEIFLYRAAQELLFWQDAHGTWHQLASRQAFEQLVRQLRLHKLAQQYTPGVALPTLPAGAQLQTLG